MQLIPEWRLAWRMSSVNLPAIGLALLTIIEGFPNAVLSAYLVLPPDIRALIDPEYVRYAGYALIAIGAVSRIVRQPKLAADKANLDSMGRESEPDVSRPYSVDGGGTGH